MSRSRLIRLDAAQQFTAINVLTDPGAIGGPKVIPNCVQITFYWIGDGSKVFHNTLVGRAAGVPNPTPAQATAIHQALTTGAAWTALAATLSTTTSFASVGLRSLHTLNQPEVLSTSGAVAGSGAAVALPLENAICVTLRTALAGAQNRGRVYLSGFTNAQVVAGNIIAPGTVTATQTWCAGFTSIFAGQGLTWVIGQPARQAYTGSTGTQHPARAAGSVPVTQAITRDNHWDSARRRGLR